MLMMYSSGGGGGLQHNAVFPLKPIFCAFSLIIELFIHTNTEEYYYFPAVPRIICTRNT